VDKAESDTGQADGVAAELIYVYLPESLGPIDRGDKYEDPIDDALQECSLGYVSGAGSALSEELPDGRREVVSCGIDVDTNDVVAARELLRERLVALGCPAGTQLHYREGETPLQDEYDGSAWALGRPRTMMHPGFGI